MATATANGVNGRTKTDEVLAWLRANEGQPLPSNTDIAEMHGTDEGTVRRARKKLEALRENPALVLEPEEVPIADLALDLGTQLRPCLDETKVVEYAEGIAEGRRDPIRVIRLPDGRLVVTDGFHRVAAHREAGLASIPAYVRDGTMDDAILEAAAANADHGLPRDTATKEAAVLALLNHADWGDRSTTWLAEAARVSPGLAAKVRRRWEAGRVAPAPATRTDRNGVARPARQFTPPPEPVHEREPGEDDDLGDEPETHKPASTRHGDGSTTADATDPHREAALALPLAAKLAEPHRGRFVRDASLYFALAERKKALGDLYRAKKGTPAAGEPKGEYDVLVERFLGTPHPRDWKECKAGNHSRSCRCAALGYIVE